MCNQWATQTENTLLKDGRNERRWMDIVKRRQGLPRTWETNRTRANRSNSHPEAPHLQWHLGAEKCASELAGDHPNFQTRIERSINDICYNFLCHTHTGGSATMKGTGIVLYPHPQPKSPTHHHKCQSNLDPLRLGWLTSAVTRYPVPIVRNGPSFPHQGCQL